MEKKNILFIKNNCELSEKLCSMVKDTFRIINVNEKKIPEELKEYEVPFIIVKKVIKPIECEDAIAYLENAKFFNQVTNNITVPVIQMKKIINELDEKGVSNEFNKVSDDYTFIEEGKNIEKVHRNIDAIDDDKKIDIMTDFNNEEKLNENDTKDKLKSIVLNRNRELQLRLKGRR